MIALFGGQDGIKKGSMSIHYCKPEINITNIRLYTYYTYIKN